MKSPELGDGVKGSPVNLPVSSTADFSNLIKMIFNLGVFFPPSVLKETHFSSSDFFFLYSF